MEEFRQNLLGPKLQTSIADYFLLISIEIQILILHPQLPKEALMGKATKMNDQNTNLLGSPFKYKMFLKDLSMCILS